MRHSPGAKAGRPAASRASGWPAGALGRGRRPSARSVGAFGFLLLAGLALGCDETETPSDAGSAGDLGLLDAAAHDAGVDGAAIPEDAGLQDAGPADAGLDCGPHGYAHFDHCHCDPGYIERDGQCVEPDECTGDDPFESDDRFRDAVEWGHEPVERWLCPGDRDHVTVELTAGDELTVTATFDHATVDVDLALYAPEADPRFDRPVARTDGVADEERLFFRVLETGAHLLRIQSPDRGAQGAYRLDLSIDTPAE